jgi:hypothetical protein
MEGADSDFLCSSVSWNNLPESIRSSPSLDYFKNNQM